MLTRKQRQYVGNYLMVLPAFGLLVMVVLYPLLNSFALSLSRYSLQTPHLGIKYVGFSNFVNLFSDVENYGAFLRTFEYTVWVVGIGQVLAGFVASALNKSFAWQKTARVLILLPMFLAPVAAGAMWRLMYDYQYGVFNYLVQQLGMPKMMWLGQPQLAMGSVIAAGVWGSMPFAVLMMLAGLQSLPVDLYEAARIDGASKWHLFQYLTVPLMAPIFMIVIMIRTMDSIRTFDMIWALTAGGPGTRTEVVSLYVYKNALQFGDLSGAAAGSVVLFLISAVISAVYIRLLWRRALA